MTASRNRNVPGWQRQLAGTMRRSQTESEKRLWYSSRIRVPIEGSHFRRQVPIGRFIADFCCHRAKLVVELDGNQHGTDAARQRDAVRTALLESEGYKVLRFTNEDVWRNLDMVLDTIFAAAAERTPTPDPSPQGGGKTDGIIGRKAKHPGGR